MKQKWVVNDNNCNIELKNLGFAGEELYINNELIDKTRTIFGNSRLIAKYNNYYIKADIKQNFTGYTVTIYTDEKTLLYQENQFFSKDIFIYVMIFIGLFGMVYTFM